MGKRKAGEERRQATDFKVAVCCPSAIVQGGQHGERMVCVTVVLGVTWTLGKANSHFDPHQTGRGPQHHVEVAVDWWSFPNFAERVSIKRQITS